MIEAGVIAMERIMQRSVGFNQLKGIPNLTFYPAIIIWNVYILQQIHCTIETNIPNVLTSWNSQCIYDCWKHGPSKFRCLAFSGGKHTLSYWGKKCMLLRSSLDLIIPNFNQCYIFIYTTFLEGYTCWFYF